MKFRVQATDGAARCGQLTFDRGVVDTPAFMPVGTYGTVKAMTPEEVEASGAQIVLGNTFHLWVRPGTEIIELHGDRSFRDDEAMVGGWARLEGDSVMVIGHQKGRDMKENLRRNFTVPVLLGLWVLVLVSILVILVLGIAVASIRISRR